MHICGASCHDQRENARETGIIEEILLENKHRNPSASYPVFDSILWEKARFQPNLDLKLNCRFRKVKMDGDRISSIEAIGLTNEKVYKIRAKIFIDATGDGSLSALAGAPFVVGGEPKETYVESMAPDTFDKHSMGSSLMFKARDTGKPVPFVKPFWAYSYTEEDLKLRDHNDITSGYWWIELGGGELGIIEDAEEIRDELLKTVFGVWEHIKNKGDHSAENFDLEWVGFLPGKRESRRIMGQYVLTQDDLTSGARFKDAVTYGGWPIDVHNNEGISDTLAPPTTQAWLENIYDIPLRCLIPKDVSNLALAGRIISCSRIAFSSTRVMSTCASVGQAVGTAAALSIKLKKLPKDFGPLEVDILQQRLLYDGCFIPGVKNTDPLDLARGAGVKGSASKEGWMPENVINGISRPTGKDSNGWRDSYENDPWLELSFPEPVTASEFRLTFDSNLTREITISLNKYTLEHQSPQTPPEIVKDYSVTLYLKGKLVSTAKACGNYQRLSVLRLEEKTWFDKAVFRFLEGNGEPVATVFEIRAYE
jgi:hypothetical protein